METLKDKTSVLWKKKSSLLSNLSYLTFLIKGIELINKEMEKTTTQTQIFYISLSHSYYYLGVFLYFHFAMIM